MPPKPQTTKKARLWYQAEPGFKMPGTANPDRPQWDAKYLSRLTEVFGGKGVELRPVKIPIATSSPYNPVHNPDRRDMYLRMLRAGEKLPPVFAQRSPDGQRWSVLDGSHRWDAAKRHGTKFIDGFEAVPVAGAPAAAVGGKRNGLKRSEDESATLEKMALADIPPGQPAGEHRHDYSHVLTDEHRAAGYTLHVTTPPAAPRSAENASVNAIVYHRGRAVGHVFSEGYPDKSMFVEESLLKPTHRRKGLGVAMYEAVLGHAKNVLGFDYLHGGKHSTSAHHLHEALKRKHGLNYQAPRNRDGGGGMFDDAYGEYGYTLKSESDLSARPAAVPAKWGPPEDEPLAEGARWVHNMYTRRWHQVDAKGIPLARYHNHDGTVEWVPLHVPPRLATIDVPGRTVPTPKKLGKADALDRHRADAERYGWAPAPQTAMMKSPAFRHRETGQIVESPVFHNEDLLPGGSEEYFATRKWEDGFIDHAGKFYNREQAARAVGAHSQDDYNRSSALESQSYIDGHQAGVYKSEPKVKALPARIQRAFDAVRQEGVLTPELLKPEYVGHPHPLGGHCYVATEALYHLINGEKTGWVPTYVKHEDTTHWFLRHAKTGTILDPTAEQFKTPVPYDEGTGCGFQTTRPSARTRLVIERVQGRLRKSESLEKTQHPIRQAAFRHKATGEVVETGQVHDYGGMEDEGHDLSEWDPGFTASDDGRFLSREEAGRLVGLDRPHEPGLDSDDPEAGVYAPEMYARGSARMTDPSRGPTGHKVWDPKTGTMVPFQPPMKKSLKEVQPGALLAQNPETGETLHDYSHLLPVPARGQYRLTLRTRPKSRIVSTHLEHAASRRGVGQAAAFWHLQDGRVSISPSIAIEPPHRGKGLGVALYEALFGHAHNVLGASEVMGDLHSTGASRVHQKLARKHGLQYRARPNIGEWPYATREDWKQAEPGPLDDRFGAYQYMLKSEGYGIWCPTCQEPATSRCRCTNVDRCEASCDNGHSWLVKNSLRKAEGDVRCPKCGSGGIKVALIGEPVYVCEDCDKKWGVEPEQVTKAEGSAPAPERDIVVTIPANKVAEVEAEEADVARRLAAGEQGITYYWQMARVPRERLRRIYFVWDGAVRAYHDVVDMKPDRIVMDPTIHTVEPVQMAGFRGYRYFDPECFTTAEPPESRPFRKAEPDPHAARAVSVLVQNHDGHILFGKRQKDGTWTLPGGHLDAGEEPATGAVRELYEETGLVPEMVHQVGAANGGPNGDIPIFVFVAVASGQPHAGNDPDHELSDFRWIDLLDGIPSDILQNLAHPKNVVLRMLGHQVW